MRKKDEARLSGSCWNSAPEDSLVFVLLDWDAATAETVRFWVHERLRLGLNKPTDVQIIEALALADEIAHNFRDARAARDRRNPKAAWPFPPGTRGPG